MSQLDDIKDKFKSLYQQIAQKIQESSWFAQLQDRYQTLSPQGQKAVWVGGSLITVFIILFYPFSLLFQSQSSIAVFEDKRALIRELFRTYHESSARPQISMPPPIDNLRSSINSILTGSELLPEQNIGVIESSVEGQLIPKSLVSHVLQVKLAKLNLKQIVDIGTSILGLSDSVKMKDMTITANGQDSRYFDVTYMLYSLNVPEPTPEPPPEIEDKPKKGSKAKSKANGDKEDKKGSDE